MSTETVYVPTLNDLRHDFLSLFSICKKAIEAEFDIMFDFTACNFLRPNAVAVLGGLARKIEKSGRRVNFDWSTLTDEKVLAAICQNGFASQFGYNVHGWEGHSIPYREDRLEDLDGIMDYLTYYWLGRGWMNVSERLRDAIAGRMWEVYTNAFEHSGSEVGVYSCGQHFKKKNSLVLSVVDFGIGIPTKVRMHLEKRSSPVLGGSGDYLRWAFKRGNSTCLQGVPRGLGLDLLKQLVIINHGKLEMYSNDGYAIVDDSGEKYETLNRSFDGTVLHITLNCDERFYKFADEN